MKNLCHLYSFFIGCLIVFAMASCDGGNFLDATETTDLDRETVFSDSANTTYFLHNIFLDIGFSSAPRRFGNGGLDAASDEAEPRRTASVSTSLQFATGTVTPSIVSADSWLIPYRNIRKVNLLLHHLPEIPIADFRKDLMALEARFLRAWYYAELLKHYGGVPLLGNTVYDQDDEIPFERSTYEETVDYIVSELDAIAPQLQVRPRGQQYGKPGAGAAMALKARVLLYGASPLFNGSDFGGGDPLVGYSNHNQERWKLAADAAKDVIDSGEFFLNVDNNTEPGYGFYELFTLRYHEEYILQRMEPSNRTLEALWQPPSRSGAEKGGYPYQEMVDAFGMSNGMPIDDPASGYDENDPYADRDPRFYHSIVYDQALLPIGGAINNPPPVDIFLGNYQGRNSGQDAVHSGTPTGYYVRKMLNNSVAANDIFNSQRSRPLMRYAEVLLNFAEATNEYEGPTSDVYEAVEELRQRAGLDPYQLDPGLSQAEMRDIIHRERQVELAYEGHRFWDVRRWMIAEETQNRVMHGMEIIRNGEEVEYNIINVRQRSFHDAMYVFPIPQGEVDKSEGVLQQNPLW